MCVSIVCMISHSYIVCITRKSAKNWHLFAKNDFFMHVNLIVRFLQIATKYLFTKFLLQDFEHLLF